MMGPTNRVALFALMLLSISTIWSEVAAKKKEKSSDKVDAQKKEKLSVQERIIRKSRWAMQRLGTQVKVDTFHVQLQSQQEVGYVMHGANAELICPGNDTEVSWFRNGDSVDEKSFIDWRFEVDDENGHLHIYLVFPTDAGIYECFRRDGKGQLEFVGSTDLVVRSYWEQIGHSLKSAGYALILPGVMLYEFISG